MLFYLITEKCKYFGFWYINDEWEVVEFTFFSTKSIFMSMHVHLEFAEMLSTLFKKSQNSFFKES